MDDTHDPDGPDDGFSVDNPESDDPDTDEFTARDAFFVGSIVGNAYEEGLKERRRKDLLGKKWTK